MRSARLGNQCLTYVPVLHDGAGWVQICVAMMESFPQELFHTTIVLPRAFKKIASNVDVKEAISAPIPYRYAVRFARPILNFRYKRLLEKADKDRTIAYFWPSPPLALVEYARSRGLVTVREMINTSTAVAKPLLDQAYSRLGLRPRHNITEAMVARERKELESYDYIFCPSPRVEELLVETGISRSRILRSSYGWMPSMYKSSVAKEKSAKFRALFVGSICVRKGIPQLLEAWVKSGVDGELVLVGEIEPALRSMVESYLRRDNIKWFSFNFDLGPYYKSADIFLFPSLEEGDPLVTYEAAGCGLPVVTTPMGSANIIKDGTNGFVRDPYDVEGLAEAITRLAKSPDLRARLGSQAGADAQRFTTELVGVERAKLLASLLDIRT